MTAALWSTAVVVTLAPMGAQAQVLISQVYGGGGATTGSPAYKQDFVELVNTGAASASLANLSIQYGSATGNLGSTSGNIMALPNIALLPGQYLLVGMSSGSLGPALPAADATGTLTMSASAGKVALVQGTTAMNCGGGTACSSTQSARIVDLVGYGSANLFEGSGAAPGLNSTVVAVRASAGCTDTQDNAADFAALTPTPRNSSSPVAACGQGGGDNGGGEQPPSTPIVPIHQIQGNGATSPLVGQTVRTEGVVTLLTNNGFFMQSLTPDSDANTSEGLFVFTSSAPTVAVNELVQLSGLVSEYNVGAATNAQTLAHTVTQLGNVSDLQVLGSGVIAPTVIDFPELNEDDLEKVEGMLVRINTPLTVSQNYFLGRYGQLTLSAGGRLIKPTNLYPAGSAGADALAQSNALRRIILDDGSSRQNPNPTPYLAEDNTVRAGDTLAGLVGVIDYGLATASNTGLADYRIHPAEAPEFTRSHPRTTQPADVGGNLKVASFNVLNYFNGNGQGGGFPTSRGASSAAEFERQRTKIITAIKAIDADIVGLMEIENDGDGAGSAIADLVAGLNAAYGTSTYAVTPAPVNGTGSDEIKVALIHKPARVTPAQAAHADTRSIHNRPPLAQSFTLISGERLMVVVNHFKSKGCSGAAGADMDQGDGQGCYNATRVAQAQALAGFIDDALAQDGHQRALVIGDLNAYGKEDPVLALASAGFEDQQARFGGEAAASYVFDGEQGYLDHALANGALSPLVNRVSTWAINADEPSVLDYNLEFKQPACATCGPDYYSPTAYRSSDHDPVVVGISLRKRIVGTAARDNLSGTAGDDLILGMEGGDVLRGGDGADHFAYLSLRDAGDTISDFTPGQDKIDLSALTAALRATLGADADLFATGHLRLHDAARGVAVQYDADGSLGPQAPVTITTLSRLTSSMLQPARDIIQ